MIIMIVYNEGVMLPYPRVLVLKSGSDLKLCSLDFTCESKGWFYLGSHTIFSFFNPGAATHNKSDSLSVRPKIMSRPD